MSILNLNRLDQASLGLLLNSSDFFLKIKYNNIHHLNKFVESTINEENNKITELVKVGLNELILSSEISDDHIQFQSDLTKIQMKSIFRVSIFISSFSLFETELSEVAKNVKYYLQQKFEEEDLKHKGIMRSKIYLSRSLEIPIEKEEEWKTLELYQKVRNAWVHNKGKIKDPTEAIKISKTFNDLEKSADKILYLKEDFVGNFLSYTESFLKKIQEKVYNELITIRTRNRIQA